MCEGLEDEDGAVAEFAGRGRRGGAASVRSRDWIYKSLEVKGSNEVDKQRNWAKVT